MLSTLCYVVTISDAIGDPFVTLMLIEGTDE